MTDYCRQPPHLFEIEHAAASAAPAASSKSRFHSPTFMATAHSEHRFLRCLRRVCRRTIGGHAELSRSKIRGPYEVLQARDGFDVAVRDPNALKTRFCPTSSIVDILSIRGVDSILENGGNKVGPLPGSEIEHHKALQVAVCSHHRLLIEPKSSQLTVGGRSFSFLPGTNFDHLQPVVAADVAKQPWRVSRI